MQYAVVNNTSTMDVVVGQLELSNAAHKAFLQLTLLSITASMTFLSHILLGLLLSLNREFQMRHLRLLVYCP